MPKKRKKRVFRENDRVVCCTDRFVLDWGYEHTFQKCMEEFRREAGVTWLTTDTELEIFRRHPLFKDCQAAYEEFASCLSKAFWAADEPTPLGVVHQCGKNPAQIAAIKAVRRHVYLRLQGKIRKGQERKLFFGRLKSARANFIVQDKKVVQTGNYYPPSASGGYYEDDYEVYPGGLTDRKTHVLLWVRADGGICTDPALGPSVPDTERYNERYGYSCGQMYLLAEDCIHLREAKIAERLHGKSLSWGADKKQGETS